MTIITPFQLKLESVLLSGHENITIPFSGKKYYLNGYRDSNYLFLLQKYANGIGGLELAEDFEFKFIFIIDELKNMLFKTVKKTPFGSVGVQNNSGKNLLITFIFDKKYKQQNYRRLIRGGIDELVALADVKQKIEIVININTIMRYL